MDDQTALTCSAHQPMGSRQSSEKDKPILFSGPMIRAVLDGRKTQTRRIVKPQPPDEWLPVVGRYHPVKIDKDGEEYPGREVFGASDECAGRICPYGGPGQRLLVREALVRPDGDPWLYAADNQPVMVDRSDETEMLVWAHHKERDYCASIHMPWWASRLTLEVMRIRVERVHFIRESDATKEGFPLPGQIVNAGGMSAGRHFEYYWRDLNGDDSWTSNPWVWVVEFKPLTQGGRLPDAAGKDSGSAGR